MSSDSVNQALPAAQQLLPPGTGLVSELDLGSGTGHRPRIPLSIELIRQLTPSDLPSIQNPPSGTEVVSVVKQLRHSHHRLAELVASGRPPVEISLVTGYSASYISSLKGDPAFNELVAHYEFQKTEIFADAMDRLKSLGLDAIEKLHERLNDPEKTWSNKELMDLVDMSLVAPTQAKPVIGYGGAVQGASLQLEVKFVGASPKNGPIVDVEYKETGPK